MSDLSVTNIFVSDCTLCATSVLTSVCVFFFSLSSTGRHLSMTQSGTEYLQMVSCHFPSIKETLSVPHFNKTVPTMRQSLQLPFHRSKSAP